MLYRIVAVFFLLSVTAAYAEEDNSSINIDEDALFSEEESVSESKELVDDTITRTIEEESVSFTGFLNSRTGYNMSRDFIYGEPDGFEQNSLLSYFQGNFSLDARLRKNTKGFVNFSANYYPVDTYISQEVSLLPTGGESYYVYESKNTTLQIEEMFADINFNRMVYLRLGKQTLAWGTGYLWVPSDLINIERKDIFDASQVREGVYGAKISIPFGTVVNFYTFIKMNDARNVDELSYAPKLEILIGNTEFSLSALLENGEIPQR